MTHLLRLFAGTVMLLALGVSASFGQEFEGAEQTNPMRIHPPYTGVSGSPWASSEAHMRANFAALGENASAFAELDDYDVFRAAKTAHSGSRLVSLTFEGWDGGQWVSDTRELITYNDEKARVERVSQRWDGAQWINRSRYLDTRGEAGLAASELQEWTETSWAAHSLYAYTYSAGGHLKEIVDQRWRDSGWQLTRLFSFNHDEAGNLILSMTESHVDGAWVGEYRRDVSYDQLGRQTQSVTQQLQTGSGRIESGGRTSMMTGLAPRNTLCFTGKMACG